MHQSLTPVIPILKNDRLMRHTQITKHLPISPQNPIKLT